VNRMEVVSNLPPLHQKLAVTVLGLLAAYWVVRQVRRNRFNESHALPWFLGIGAGLVVVWCDPLLVMVTSFMGVDVPASALLLLSLFFLFLVCAWLTSMVSSQQRTIAKLVIEISILKSKREDSAARGAGDDNDR
jgi:hypothetical protein